VTDTDAVDAYIAAAPKAAQPRLRALRKLIKAAAPQATERLSYRMPYYDYKGRLIYFSAFKNHIGVYPVGEAANYKELSKYMTGRGTYRFPLDEPMPMDLIKKLVEARVKKNDAAAGTRASARPYSSARSASRGASRGSRPSSR
jgi:uncharacterized protein YdhG (YjbR/CyaY superfamily)